MQRILFLLSLMFVVTVGAVAVESGHDLDRSFHSSPGNTLNIDLRTGGDVRISGASGDNVSVKVRVSGRDSEDVEVMAEQTSSGVEVSSRFTDGHHNHNANADVEVQVPSRYGVQLETMGGEVTIQGVEGKFEGKTMGGEITLQHLKGNVDLTTMGGDIQVSDSELDGEVKTMGGDVVLRSVAGNVHGSTMGGNVREEGTPAPGKSSGSTGEKRIHSMGGDLDLASAPAGASLETMGGDIHIVSANDHVKAQTMGGNIQVDSIDGWADLTTMGGDVTMHMVGDPKQGKRDVEISSMGGDIEISLPAGISATFDLETEYMLRSRNRTPKIISDFPIQISESNDCDHDHGESCKSLVGSGKAGSGTHRIKIRTIQGDITIRKG